MTPGSPSVPDAPAGSGFERSYHGAAACAAPAMPACWPRPARSPFIPLSLTGRRGWTPIDMPRYQVDDSFYDDPAVSRAGTAAVGLYFRCGLYVARHLLDGHVPTEVATQYGTPEWVTRLTDVGLWETVPGGHY